MRPSASEGIPAVARGRRHLWLLGAVVAGLALLGALQAVRAAAPRAEATYTIYGDALAPGWQNWSWHTATDFAENQVVYTGTAAISFTYTSAYGGLYLSDAGGSVDTTPYTDLTLWVNGGPTGGQNLAMSSYVNYNTANYILLNTYLPGRRVPANTWFQVDVPLTALKIDQVNLTGIALEDASGGVQPTIYLDQVQLVHITPRVTPTPTPAIVPVQVSVDAAAGRQPISPYLYGMAFASPQQIAANNVTLNRWGGDATTRYDWKTGNSSLGADWYFMNYNSQALFSQTADQFVRNNITSGAASLVTIPTIGWVAKDGAYNGASYGFSVKKYGPQQRVDPYRTDAGNGVKPDDGNVTDNDPRDTSTRVTPSFMSQWVQHLVSTFGAANQGGVRFYAMDNEPELWPYTHRDVHPAKLTDKTELAEFLNTAVLVKKDDPSADVNGPISWGWPAYFSPTATLPPPATGSFPSVANAQADTILRMLSLGPQLGQSSRDATSLPFIAWFLQQVRAHDTKTGTRTLDVLDVHAYPMGNNVFGGGTDPATNALRLRETRMLWDPAYVDESWINQPMYIIPRMQAWINQYYPGTKFGISEWNYGADNTVNGALTIGTVLGIYGKYGVYSANYWTTPGQAGQLAFQMYRNYDGQNGAFGDTSIAAMSSLTTTFSVFSAVDSHSGAMTTMLINADPYNIVQSSLSLANFTAAGTAHVYQYGNANPGAIVHLPDITAGSQMSVTLPPYSMMLLVIPAGS